MLSLAEPPTVLCCGNDQMAMMVYGILRSMGRKVPEEISVAGYDELPRDRQTPLFRR